MQKLFRSMGAGAGAFILAIASTISYFLGWLRDALFVRIFGVTAVTDSYFKAFLLPDTLLTICITGALLGLVIPLYVRAQKISEPEGAKVFGTFFFVLNGMYLFGALLCLMFLGPILQFIFPDTLSSEQPVLQQLTTILICSNLCFALSNFLGHFLLAHKRFIAYSLSPLLYNIGIIAGILWGHGHLGIHAAAWGALLGAFFHLTLRFVDFLHCSQKFSFALDIRNPFFLDLLKGMWPKMVALMSLQIGFYFFARMGDGILGAGNYSAFQYARNLQSFAVSLFGISLATAVFPFLSEFVAEKKIQHFIFRFEKSLRQILFLALPAAVGMAFLASEVVRFIYGDHERNVLTVAVLIPLACTIPFESVNHLLVRSFHVLKSTILPMISSLIFLSLLMGISAVLVLQFDFGVGAFGISYLIGFCAQVTFLFSWLPRLAVPFPWKEFLPKFAKTVLLTILMSGIVFGVLFVLPREQFFLRFFVPIIIGGGVFFSGAFAWKAPEVYELPIRKWFSKDEEVQEGREK